jgi:serine/threonine-protein kinase
VTPAAERFGKYEVVSKIGQGAMGDVFRARDTVLGRDVALKTISAEKADEALEKRFRREAESAARLAHPNIITIYDFDQERGRMYMAMELLEGRDLKAVLSGGSLRTLEDKVAVVEQIASGLAFAHQNGVVHRDLKPANIHLRADGQVKIMDFGLARVSGSDMTRTGIIMGTPHYMAPEQVRGERADERSDVFALGCILYELLAGKRPFDAESMHAVLFKVLQAQPTPITQAAPDVPVVLAQVLEGALAKEPDDRFPNAGAFLSALQAARQAVDARRGDQALPDLRRPAPPPSGKTAARSASTSGPAAPRTSHGPVFTVAVLLVAGLLAGAFWLLRPATGTPPPSAEQKKLAAALAQNQLELARKKLEARDYREAVRQAEKAQGLDPANPEAAALLAQAQGKVAERGAAEAQAREAQVSGDPRRSAEALWTLMRLEPDHPLVSELASLTEAEFQTHAEEAHRLFLERKQAAEQTGLNTAAEYVQAAQLQGEAEAAMKSRRWATAAARLLSARDRLDRLK